DTQIFINAAIGIGDIEMDFTGNGLERHGAGYPGSGGRQCSAKRPALPYQHRRRQCHSSGLRSTPSRKYGRTCRMNSISRVASTAVASRPSPTQTPTAAVIQTPAAVVRPLTSPMLL